MNGEYEKELKSMTKAQLIDECINQRERGDIEHDNYMCAMEQIDEIDTYGEEEALELEEIKTLIKKIKHCKDRILLGVKTAEDDLVELMDKLLEIET